MLFCEILDVVEMKLFVPVGVLLVGVTLLLKMCAMPGMRKHVDQRVNLKFLVAQELSPINCWRQLHAVYGEDCMSKETVR